MNMPLKEITNNRPKNYSRWHRTLPSWCYQTDGDFFEQRKHNGSMVTIAYVETIEIPMGKNHVDYPIWDSKKALLTDIKNKMSIPCFVVWHYPNCKTFFVMKWGNNNTMKMCEQDYKSFILNLKGC